MVDDDDDDVILVEQFMGGEQQRNRHEVGKRSYCERNLQYGTVS